MAKKKTPSKSKSKKPQRLTRRLTCADCGKEFQHPVGPGSYPKYCPLHRPKQNRNRDVGRAEKLGDGIAGELARGTGLGGALPAGADAAVAPLRLAIAMSLIGDLQQAADVAGVVDVETVEPQARQRYPGLIEGRAGELQRILHASAAMASVSLFAQAPRMSGQQAAAAIKSVAQTLELVQHGAKRVHAQINILMPARRKRADEE